MHKQNLTLRVLWLRLILAIASAAAAVAAIVVARMDDDLDQD